MKKITKLIPYEVWWILVGLNYGIGMFGVFLNNYSLLGLGIFSALSCAFSAVLYKKINEEGE